MPESRESTSLAAVVGENCRRIRLDAGVTQNALAKHACTAGLRWTASKVGQFERGQHNPAFSTVLAVAYVLSRATGGVVVLADLVRSDGYVVINDRLDPQGDLLEAFCAGRERDLRAGADASPQKRGQISRTPVQELREELSRGDDS